MVRRAVAGAVLLDLAVSPLFVWDVLDDALAREIGRSSSALTVVYAVGLACFTVGVVVGGRLADRVAPRRLALATAVGVAAGLAGTAVAPGVVTMVLAFGVVLGAATGVGYATAVRIAGSVVGRRGLAVSLVVSAYAAGAVVLSPVADLLLDEIGTPATMLALALVLGGLVLVASLLVPGVVRTPRGTERRRTSLRPVRGVVVLWWGVFALGSAPALIAFGHAAGLAGDAGLAAVAVMLLNAGNLAGRLVAGPARDRIGSARALHLTAAALLASVAGVAAAGPTGLALAALFVLGCQYGALSVLVPVAVSESVPADRFGTAYGVVFTGWGTVGLLGPLLAAALARGVDYGAVAWVLLAPAAAFWLLVPVAVRHRRRNAVG
jgi:MFS transporter, OFA family, oxalate/formate antiporter